MSKTNLIINLDMFFSLYLKFGERTAFPKVLRKRRLKYKNPKGELNLIYKFKRNV